MACAFWNVKACPRDPLLSKALLPSATQTPLPERRGGGGGSSIQMPEARGAFHLNHYIQIDNFRLNLQMKEK